MGIIWTKWTFFCCIRTITYPSCNSNRFFIMVLRWKILVYRGIVNSIIYLSFTDWVFIFELINQVLMRFDYLNFRIIYRSFIAFICIVRLSFSYLFLRKLFLYFMNSFCLAFYIFFEEVKASLLLFTKPVHMLAPSFF